MENQSKPFNMCLNKVKHNSKAEALGELEYWRREGAIFGQGQRTLKVYKCPFCSSFHIGNRKS